MGIITVQCMVKTPTAIFDAMERNQYKIEQQQNIC